MPQSTVRSLLFPSLEICSTTSRLKQTHAHLITTGSSNHDRTVSHILQICARSAPPDPLYARLLFDRIQTPTTFAWNCLLRSQSNTQNPNATISLYNDLLQSGAKPSGITFAFVLKACAALRNLDLVMGIHSHFLSSGFHSDPLVVNSSIRAYTVCGFVDYARRLFDGMLERDLISCTEVINGYLRIGRAKEAVDMFFLMMESKVRPDEVTVVAFFTACSQLGDLSLGRKLQTLAYKTGVRFNTYVVNSLIHMYCKCGSIDDARVLFDGMVDKDAVSWNSMVSGYAKSGDMEAAERLFDRIPNKNEVSWSSLINGYVQNGCFEKAVTVFRELRGTDVAPNEAAITGAITACAHLGALDLGREIHRRLDDDKVRSDVVLSTALMDMYAKCGCLEMARALFDRIAKKNLVSWNVMMMAMAIHGKASECLVLFDEMLEDGLKPNSMSFVGILSACAHAGLLDEGMDYFDQMATVYGITPLAEHCSCIVHLMGRSGILVEACEFIRASPLGPDVATWGALLSACKVHGYVELGEYVAEMILELDPCHSGAYVQLSGIYAAVNKWREVLELRKTMKERGVRNRAGWSWFELDGTIHEFRVGVNLHPRIEEIRSVSHSIGLQMSSMHFVRNIVISPVRC